MPRPSSQLVRRVVGEKLSAYYAQPADRVVGQSSSSSTYLSSLLGEWHWRRVFRKVYEERQGQWLTPVELFRPYYSNILAEFITAHTNEMIQTLAESPLEIIELGGGRGTNANLILSYLQETQPQLYDCIQYTLVDSSPSLHRLQREALGGGEHSAKINFELKDLVDVAEQRVSLVTKSDTPTIILGMEVLDNLPHDKIRAKTRKKMEQAQVREMANGLLTEDFVTLSDPLLANILKKVPAYAKTYPSWIPSVACGVLHHVLHQRRNLGVVLADFDWLPAPDLLPDSPGDRISMWAEGEPIVTDMEGVDHECYLRSPEHCDILFPTDFEKLESFVKRSAPNNHTSVVVEKQCDFLERYGSHQVRKTKSWLTGHTPLLHDFLNCSVMTVTSSPHRIVEQ